MFKVECCGRTDSTVNKNVRHIFYFKVTFRKSSCLGEASHHQHTPGVFTIDALTDSCCVQSCANFCWHWLKPLAEAVVLFFLRKLLCYSVRPWGWTTQSQDANLLCHRCFICPLRSHGNGSEREANVRRCWFHVCVTLADRRRVTKPLPVLTQKRTSCTGRWQLVGRTSCRDQSVSQSALCCLTRRSLQGREEFSITPDSRGILFSTFTSNVKHLPQQ